MALRPHALFTLAEMLRARGDDLLASDRYLELVTMYPRASDAATAHLALAEIAFAHEELGDALRSCDAALAGTPGLGDDQRVTALYMKAWTLRGLGDAAEPHATLRAMEALRQVIALAARLGGTSKMLGDSAEGELVQLFAEHGDPRTAEGFFHSLGARTQDRMLPRSEPTARERARSPRSEHAPSPRPPQTNLRSGRAPSSSPMRCLETNTLRVVACEGAKSDSERGRALRGAAPEERGITA